METYLGEARIAAGGLFQPKTVRAMVDAHVKGRENYSHQLWALLIFEIWRETYIKS
jgi:asparagine synthase (glutamine-hydrolysing)